MTTETLERLKLFVSGHRHKSLVCALSAREHGHKQIALDHENEAQLAALLLKDLEKEKVDALQIESPRSVL
jgi:hypothetical protein